MDVLRSTTTTGSAGFYSCSSKGLNSEQIIAIERQGIQHDYIDYLSLSGSNRSWSVFGKLKRIYFDAPFGEGGETIFIIYKVTT